MIHWVRIKTPAGNASPQTSTRINPRCVRTANTGDLHPNRQRLWLANCSSKHCTRRTSTYNHRSAQSRLGQRQPSNCCDDDLSASERARWPNIIHIISKPEHAAYFAYGQRQAWRYGGVGSGRGRRRFRAKIVQRTAKPLAWSGAKANTRRCSGRTGILCK